MRDIGDNNHAVDSNELLPRQESDEDQQVDNTLANSIIIFANENEDLINKWISIMNYLINNQIK
jgi:hypothetical protein